MGQANPQGQNLDRKKPRPALAQSKIDRSWGFIPSPSYFRAGAPTPTPTSALVLKETRLGRTYESKSNI